MDFVLSPGQTHESRHAVGLLAGVQAGCVLGDRAYDGAPIRNAIAEMGAEAVIPPHPCRKAPATDDTHPYRARHAIENLFAKLKQYRSLATRYDKTMRNYSAMVTDNGSAYKSKVFAATRTRLNLKHLRTRPYRPRTNGKAERPIQTVLRNWVDGVPWQSSRQQSQPLPSVVSL